MRVMQLCAGPPAARAATMLVAKSPTDRIGIRAELSRTGFGRGESEADDPSAQRSLGRRSPRHHERQRWPGCSLWLSVTG